MEASLTDVVDYRTLHPIRFMVGVAVCVVVVAATALYARYRLKRRTTVPAFNSYIDPQPERKLSLQNLVFLGLGILIGVGGSWLFMNPSYIRKENTDISKSDYVFGIDVSQYQARINWNRLATSHHPIEYVFIRSTMGKDGKDKQFSRNWKEAKRFDYVRAAYHYFRPNENSTAQFRNFSATVTLNQGDFPPILDIEEPSKFGKEKLREGVLNWLKLAESKYGIKPMIYTGRTFYRDYLQGHVDGYPLWIAAYSGKKRLTGIDWDFHQFTEKVRVNGIINTVDGNDFSGTMRELRGMCLH